MPWNDRGRVKPPWGYAVSVLNAADLPRFVEFNERLRWLHVERNFYNWARTAVLASDDDSLDLFFPERSSKEQADLLALRSHVMIAIELFDRSLRQWDLDSWLRFLLLWTAAEALFGDEEVRSELTYRLCLRMALLLGDSPDSRKLVFDRARELYKLRSRLVHGSVKFLTVDAIDVTDLARLVRASLLYYIAFAAEQTRKADTLKSLDAAVIEGALPPHGREIARRYWGDSVDPADWTPPAGA